MATERQTAVTNFSTDLSHL